jgi:ATP-dependent Lon protease
MPSFNNKSANKNDKKISNKKNKLRKNKDSDSESDDDIIIDGEESVYETVSESETSDSSYKPPKKNNKNKKNRRRIIESEDEDEDDEESIGSEDTDEDDEEEETISRLELQKIITKAFPSKYSKDKLRRMIEEDSDEEDDEDEEEIPKRKNRNKKTSKKSKSSHNKKRKSKKEESDEEDDIEEDEEYDEEEYEENEEDDKIDIVFTIGGNGMDEYYDAFGKDEYNEEDDVGDCNSDDEKTFMKEKYEPVEMPKNEKKSSKEVNKKSKHDKKNKETKTKDDKKKDEVELTDVEQEYLDLVETKKTLTTQLHKKPKSKILLNAIHECDKSIKKLVKKARIKNAKNYHKLIHDDSQNTNEIDYFKKKLSNKEQLSIMKDLKEINSYINIEKPYRLALLQSKIPANFKAMALQKLNVLKSMDPSDSEYYKMKNWVDTFMRIPFCKYKNLSVKLEDGLDVCHDFMENAKSQLDHCVYGLNDAKLQIMQMVGQWISNPASLGTAIAINGPPGTGKTSLVKEGISKILGREFAFIALGGSGDSSFLEGHSYTYEGSTWGKIVQIIIDSKCMNPVIYFDELDKISDTPRGEEIIGILTHLTDTSQNSQFHDKYFSGIDFDLSKCLFIFSYNDESKVNPILKDRMYRIQTKGYDSKEKLIIAKDYLLPKIREQVSFTAEEVIIPDETIQYIVSNKALTKDESGVRNLKRCLEIIHTKLNLFRLVKPNTSLFNKDMNLEVSFPMTVTKNVVDILIKNEEHQNQSMLAMYC